MPVPPSEQHQRASRGRQWTVLAVLAAALIAFGVSFAAAWALRGDDGTASAGPDRAPEPVAAPAPLTISADPTAPVAPLPALSVPVPAAAPQVASPGTSPAGAADPVAPVPADPAPPVVTQAPVVTREAAPIIEDR